MGGADGKRGNRCAAAAAVQRDHRIGDIDAGQRHVARVLDRHRVGECCTRSRNACRRNSLGNGEPGRGRQRRGDGGAVVLAFIARDICGVGHAAIDVVGCRHRVVAGQHASRLRRERGAGDRVRRGHRIGHHHIGKGDIAGIGRRDRVDHIIARGGNAGDVGAFGN